MYNEKKQNFNVIKPLPQAGILTGGYILKEMGWGEKRLGCLKGC